MGVWVQGVEGKRSASAVGILTCGSVHICPVCARRIRTRRMVQLSKALRGGLEACPRAAWNMISVTARHHRGMRLSWFRDVVMRGWRRCRQMGSVQRIFKNRVQASARAFEVTFSFENGWHPHLHIALLTTDWTERERKVLALTFLRSCAAEACDKMKGIVTKTNRKGMTKTTHEVIAWDVASYRKWLAFFTEYQAHAIKWSSKKLSRGDDSRALEAYLTDIGLELSMGATKTTHAEGSRTPWQIAEAAVSGDERAKALWWEYENAIKGTRCIELDDRAAAFAESASIARACDEVTGELSTSEQIDEAFKNAETTGADGCFAELDPEMMPIVREYERHIDPRATMMWLEAAAATRGPLTAASIRDSVDACIRGMVESLRQWRAVGKNSSQSLPRLMMQSA